MDTKSIAKSGIRGEEAELLPCGCAPTGSRSRKRCGEGSRLRRMVRALLDEEAAARKEYGPASAERHQVMKDRLTVQREYEGHVARLSCVGVKRVGG